MEETKEMKGLQKNRGITLIALIITIIILLILAMVTINILINQGIIGHANNAVNQYEVAEEKEKIALGYQNYKMDKLNPDKEAKLTVDGAQDPIPGDEENGWTITFTKTGHVYKLKDGNITAKRSAASLNDIEKYFFGAEGEGRSIMEIVDTNNWVYKDDDATLENASAKVKFMNFYAYAENYATGNIEYAFYFRYENKAYKVLVKGAALTTSPDDGLQVVYEHQEGSVVGKKVQYKATDSSSATDWIVLYENNDGTIDIMSKDVMGSLTLGSGDVNATGSSNAEKAINSYNGAIDRINDYCASLVTNTTAKGVRSAGYTGFETKDGKLIAMRDATSKYYTSDNLKNWQSGTYNEKGKVNDRNGEQDLIRMSYYYEGWNTETPPTYNHFGYAEANNNYWLASRFVYEYPSYVYFYVICVNGGLAGNRDLWNVDSSNAYDNSPSYAVRPVVRVDKTAVSGL